MSKYKLIIFNYNSYNIPGAYTKPPIYIFANKNNIFPPIAPDIYDGIVDEIFRHWKNNTWWFGEKESGMHTFELDDWNQFYEDLKNYE